MSRFAVLIGMMISWLVTPQALARGGDVSAGGGAGNLSIASGFNPGKFDVSIRSGERGILKNIQKYFMAAGAETHESTEAIVVARSESSIGLRIAKDNTKDKDPFFTLGFAIAYSELHELRNGVNPRGEIATYFDVGGEFAQYLYSGMEKSGVDVDHYSVSATGEKKAAYRENNIACSYNFSGVYLGYACSFLIINN